MITPPRRMQKAIPTVKQQTEPDAITMAQFLEEEPLHARRAVSHLFSNVANAWIYFPDDIRVHCLHEDCNGIRRHNKEDKSGDFRIGSDLVYAFAVYRCTDCRKARKVLGVRAERDPESNAGQCTKIYQEPAFGNPIPKRLFHIIGETNRESFLQARRAIARGLGIGAYSYYRRIVENTKFELVDSVLEVARATNAPAEQIKSLESAQAEGQFSKAMETLRDVSMIPPVLLIDGHNPLAVLHDLLSEGIHELSDEDCLERTQHAEILLFEIADRMQIALTERKTVKAAITSVMNRKTESKGS